MLEPLLDEAARRYDPTVDDTQLHGTELDEAALLQLLVSWREQAFRNAELLVSSPTYAADTGNYAARSLLRSSRLA